MTALMDCYTENLQSSPQLKQPEKHADHEEDTQEKETTQEKQTPKAMRRYKQTLRPKWRRKAGVEKEPAIISLDLNKV